MASQNAIELVLLLVLVSAATTLSYVIHRDELIYLTAADNEKLQFLAKFAVDKYNEKNGGSHMYFMESVLKDSIILKPYYPSVPRVFYVWGIKLKAKNCTSGIEDFYSAQVTENFDLPGQIQAYNSNFTASGYLFKYN